MRIRPKKGRGAFGATHLWGLFGKTRLAPFSAVGALLAAAPWSFAAPPEPPAPAPLPNFAADLPPAPSLPSQLPTNIDAKPAEPVTPPATPPATGIPATPTAPAQQAPSNCASEPTTKEKWKDTHCGPCEEFWFEAGYRLWWIKDARIQTPLVTTGPAASAGIPGTPGTSILFGNEDVNYGSFNGLTLDGGLWLDCRHTFGIEMNGFYFGREDTGGTFSSDANGNPFIARPFTSGLTMNPASLIVSSPGVLAGSVNVATSSRLAGAGMNFVKNISNCESYTVDYLAGFRYIDVEEMLNVAQQSIPLNGGTLAFGGNNNSLPPGVGLSLLDNFSTRNQFYGGVLGSRAEWRMGPAFIDLSSTVALGPNHEVLEIAGRTTPLMPGAGPLPGGLLAVGGGNETIIGANGAPTAFIHDGNIGRYSTSRFAYAPEVSAQIGAYVTGNIKLAVGYNFLYISDTLRPGTQIDQQINTRFVPASPAFGSTSGQAVPMVTARREDYHAQGVQFTAEFKY
jgi:Putative beta barrel porin-7 (BBP7)